MSLVLFLVFLPAVAGILLPVLRLRSRTVKQAYVIAVLAVEAVMTVVVACRGNVEEFVLLSLLDELQVSLFVDGISKIFSLFMAAAWLLVGIYAFVYMQHEEREDTFFAFFLIAEGTLMGLDFAGNLVSMYLFFELLTILSMPLVLHSRTKESIRAAQKYLYYSVAGAFMGLCGIMFFSHYCDSLSFQTGGTLNMTVVAGHETLILVVTLVAVLGFGAKAGLYPLHGWLPTAHPVAPAPASAVLSGIIAKAGVLSIIRVVYFVVGPAFLAGTWVQYVLLTLAVLTVFMGSMMAYKERVFKKRLAYSTVSQVSYVLVGLFCMTAAGVVGALLHVLFHATVKVCLFLVAGSIIYNTGKTRVDEYRGIGKQMPITMWCYSLASLALIGIPPTSGYISKWFLGLGALGANVQVLDWLAPVILLVSALLTAGYLLPVTISGFFPGKDYEGPARGKEGGVQMWLPIAVLAALAVAMGIFSAPIIEILQTVAAAIV